MCNLINDILPQNHFERKHYRDRKREEKIQFYTDLLCNGKINTRGFLGAMADESGKNEVQRFFEWANRHLFEWYDE